MLKYPEWFLRRMLFITIYKGEGDRVREWIIEGADPNWLSPKGRPALIRAVRNSIVEFDVVKALLDNGADPKATDELGCTALDHARRRLAKYDGRPRRKPRRSPSLTEHGDVILDPSENAHLDEIREKHPESADDFEQMYLEERRKAAERTFDTRGNLERIVPLLESVSGA